MLTRISGRLMALAAVAITAVAVAGLPASRPAAAQGFFSDPFVQLAASTTRPEPGAQMDINLTVGNAGSYPAYDVKARLQLPAGFGINVVFPPQWSGIADDGTRMWCDIPASDTVTCDVPVSFNPTPLTARVVVFAPLTQGSYIAQAEIVQNGVDDANLSNSAATLGVRVSAFTTSLSALRNELAGVQREHPVTAADPSARPRLLLRPDLYARTLGAGVPLEASRSGTGLATVGFFIGNEGSVDVAGITLFVTVPGGFTLGQVGSPSGFACTPSAAGGGMQVKCAGDLRAGAMSEIRLPLAQVTAPLGTYQIQAVIDPGNVILESDEADNSATVTIKVTK